MSFTFEPIEQNAPLVPAWTVQEGRSIQRFVASKSGPGGMSAAEIAVVVDESKDILGHGVNPKNGPDEKGVLVVGYVQSGKTLSFTAVTALARDNGFGIVILLAGTTNELKGQSEDRLSIDLAINTERDWRLFDNPDKSDASHDELKRTLAGWRRFRNGKTQHPKPALLVTVLKNSTRLNHAAEAMRLLDLQDVPILLIDDESDQAGLNTQARKNLLKGTVDESGVYEAILGLRGALPMHTMLQYTATPQANLLVAMSDSLNANYAKVISSGAAYTGGRVFFEERRDLLIPVPDGEIVNPTSLFSEPPAMLQEALRFFLLAISAPRVVGAPRNYSMMVQPHQYKLVHKMYRDWVQSLLDTWESVLLDGEADEVAEVEIEFKSAYDRLARTVHDLPDLPVILAEVGDVISDIRVVVVNSTKDAQKKIDWKTWDYWILIGGQKLDRGFTVEGLISTYMPRPVSDNADVLQQRARFFGYKRTYLEYCRLFLTSGLTAAFSGYVKDEDQLRTSLTQHSDRPLSEWRRDFMVDEAIARPTRSNVIGRRQKSLPLNRGWAWPKSMHLSAPDVAVNNDVANQLKTVAEKVWSPDTVIDGVIDKRPTVSTHVLTDVPLTDILNLLIAFRFRAPDDALLASAVELALTRLQRTDSAAVGDVIFMNDLEVSSGPGRTLSVLRSNIHVGETPQGATGDALTYSGDRSIVRNDVFGLQLRRLNVVDGARSWNSVLWPAFHLPQSLRSRAWLEAE